MIGPEKRDIESALAVATTSTVYSKSFNLSYGRFFALSYKATSAGAVNLKIELEQCYEPPTTEGSADGDFAVPEGVSEIDAGLTDENQHHISVSPIPLKYGRFKVTGLAGNDASTTLELKLSTQEE